MKLVLFGIGCGLGFFGGCAALVAVIDKLVGEPDISLGGEF